MSSSRPSERERCGYAAAVTAAPPRRGPLVRALSIASILFVALGVPGCTSGTSTARGEFVPETPGVLTVATATVPVPGFWEGSADAPDGGIEAGLADAMAERFGLDRVEVIEVPFLDIVAGDLGGADLALTQMTPTDERDETVDFTTPYLDATPGVLVRRGVEAIDASDLRSLRWVVIDVSTLTPRVLDEIRPEPNVSTVTTRAEALDLLREDRADAVLLDLPVAQGLAVAEPDAFEVAAQLEGDEGLAAVLPNGSDDLMAVDSAVRALVADGTIDDLRADSLPRPANDVPLIRTSG
ncbi:MAG: amino acid ABC transporter substrate-binding protein [Acidimicrobiales bacterium]|nr:amino acid ABC transporter substrate-binding protein [Acidimicrobiales bacterium]